MRLLPFTSHFYNTKTFNLNTCVQNVCTHQAMFPLTAAAAQQTPETKYVSQKEALLSISLI